MSTEIDPAEIEAGKTLALLSWVGMFVGIPLFLLPFLQRDNAFALFHAKQAAVVFGAAMVLFVALMAINVVTCGLGMILFPLLFAPLILAIDGLLKAINGRVEAPMFLGDLATNLMSGLQVEKK